MIRRQIALVAALLLAILSMSPVSAVVERSESGIGGALIVPYWLASSQTDTLLSIRNEGDRPTAVRARFVTHDSDQEFGFNIYLDAREIWVAAATDGPALLQGATGCVAPGPPPISNPPLPNGFIGLTTGSIEIIEMGRPAADSGLAVDGEWIDCEELRARQDQGEWLDDPNTGFDPPPGRISASATLIDVEAGGMNAVEATALQGFSDVPLHAVIGSAGPTLSSATDSSAPEGGTRSRVCTAEGCVVHEWDLPVKAVSAALTTTTMRGSFSIPEGSNGQTELLVHRPLQRYMEEGGEFDVSTPLRVEWRDRSGELITRSVIIACDPPLPDNRPCIGEVTIWVYDENPINGEPITTQVIPFSATFLESVETFITDMLEFTTVTNITIVRDDGDYPQSGIVLVDLANEFDEDEARPLVHPDGTVYLGEPLIGFVVQQFSNGTLDFGNGPVLANYRSTEPMTRTVRLEEQP